MSDGVLWGAELACCFFQGEDGIRYDLVTGVQTCAFFFQAEDGIRDDLVTGVQTCALPILSTVAVIHRPKRTQMRLGLSPRAIAGSQCRARSRSGLPGRPAAACGAAWTDGSR